MKLIVEHLEPCLSEWLWLEYRHASSVWEGNVIFTNVKRKEDREKLKTLGYATEKRFYEVTNKNLIVLDPHAGYPLTPADFKSHSSIVIGGILGDEAMKGRTTEYISKVAENKCTNVIFRNLGKTQLPIDQAAIAAKRIAEGKKLPEIEIVNGVEVILEEQKEGEYRHTVFLPYGYVREKGKIAFAPGFVEYLKKGWNI